MRLCVRRSDCEEHHRQHSTDADDQGTKIFSVPYATRLPGPDVSSHRGRDRQDRRRLGGILAANLKIQVLSTSGLSRELPAHHRFLREAVQLIPLLYPLTNLMACD